MKTKVGLPASIFLVVAVLAIIFGVMWYQSEAPKVNRLPQMPVMSMPAGAGGGLKNAEAKPQPPAKKAVDSHSAEHSSSGKE